MHIGWLILLIFICCSIYVQRRGKVHHSKLRRALTDHANFLSPINCLFYAFSKVPTTPFVSTDAYPELKIVEDNWLKIRQEAMALNEQSSISASDRLDDIGFNSFFKTGWKRFYLTWYGEELPSAQRLCPETLKIIHQLPSVRAAMFTVLPPGARLVRHRDPYGGSLRYHMGLDTPEDDDCFIEVDGERHSWRNGQGVIFDETYLHYAENKTDKTRLIFFLDMERPLSNRFATWVNHMFSRFVMGASVTCNVEGERVGAINRSFATLYKIRAFGKKIKAYNRTLYYTLVYAIYLLLIYLIFL